MCLEISVKLKISPLSSLKDNWTGGLGVLGVISEENDDESSKTAN